MQIHPRGRVLGGCKARKVLLAHKARKAQRVQPDRQARLDRKVRREFKVPKASPANRENEGCRGYRVPKGTRGRADQKVIRENQEIPV